MSCETDLGFSSAEEMPTEPVSMEGHNLDIQASAFPLTEADLEKTPPAGLSIKEWAKIGLPSAIEKVNASKRSKS